MVKKDNEKEELSEDTLDQIERSRKRFKQGIFVSEKEAKELLNLL